MESFVARQPIFNQKKEIVAFELLFRNGLHNAMPEMDGDEASCQLLTNTFLNIGIETLTEGKKAFINFTENLLLQKVPLMLPVENTVVEILESVNPTPEVLQACQEMAQKGYVLALDDFIYSTSWQDIIQEVSIIKIDFRKTTKYNILKCMTLKTKKPLTFLAEKIESYEEFRLALNMGFSLFQGYFFCRPEIIQGKKIQGQTLNLLQITMEISKKNINFDHIEALIHRDVGIAYTFLRYINSAFFNRAEKITSIREALVFLGTDEIRRFIAIIALTKIGTNKPEALLKASCTRGKFCERLSISTRKTDLSNELFTLGMFSLLDAILDESMENILERLPLSKNINDALLYGEGPLFPYLSLALAYEQGRWEEVPAAIKAIGIPETEIPGLYLEACEWSQNIPTAIEQ